ncbi:SgcJ/EcaC family oxidoreductase [Angustibacter sp. McL0619]|uniref:SgcJ/EcaC family oxidoreductase n=1 Tax=Angustibacter sp. McL0619 TaxID=3415676 RepID=UPI003CEE8636
MTTTMTTTTTELPTDARRVALEVLARLEAAWNDGDGAAFGAEYAADASFVTIRGEHIVGSRAIGAGHGAIFASIYAGSVNRMELVSATETAPGVVLSIAMSTLDAPSGPLAGRHHAMSTSVFVRRPDGAGDWQIASTHNTLMTA